MAWTPNNCFVYFRLTRLVVIMYTFTSPVFFVKALIKTWCSFQCEMAAQPGHLQNLSSISTFSFLICIKINNWPQSFFIQGLEIRACFKPAMALLWLQQVSECVSICIFAAKINFSSTDQSLQEVRAEPVVWSRAKFSILLKISGLFVLGVLTQINLLLMF